MLHVHVHKVRDGEEPRLRAWLQELDRRPADVRETFRQEGVRQEAAYLVETAAGTLLVYASDVEDPERARAAFEASALAIDREHADVMGAVLGESLRAEPVFSCAVDAGSVG